MKHLNTLSHFSLAATGRTCGISTVLLLLQVATASVGRKCSLYFVAGQTKHIFTFAFRSRINRLKCASLRFLNPLHFLLLSGGALSEYLATLQTERTEHFTLLTYYHTPRSRVLLEKLPGSQLVNKLPTLYGTECSLPRLQVPAICTYLEPAQSSPCLQSHFLNAHLIIILPSMSGSYRWSVSLKFPHKIPQSPIRATCRVHDILFDLITRTILGEEYRSLSPSLCSFLHSPVTSSLLGPNILLRTLCSNTLSLRSCLAGMHCHRVLTQLQLTNISMSKHPAYMGT